VGNIARLEQSQPVVVGWAMTESGAKHAFRWMEHSGMEDLNEVYAHLLTDSSILTTAIALSSDARFIVGNGWNAKTKRKEVFWLDTQGSTGVSPPFAEDQRYCGINFDPTTGVLQVRCDFQYPVSVRVAIFDALGRAVNAEQSLRLMPGQSTIQIGMSPLSQGWYWCMIELGNKLRVHPFFVAR